MRNVDTCGALSILEKLLSGEWSLKFSTYRQCVQTRDFHNQVADMWFNPPVTYIWRQNDFIM